MPCRHAGAFFFHVGAPRPAEGYRESAARAGCAKDTDYKTTTPPLYGLPPFYLLLRPLFRANILLRVGMGISDLHFDILEVMRWEHVARLPRRKRREALFELARRVAKDFLRTAGTRIPRAVLKAKPAAAKNRPSSCAGFPRASSEALRRPKPTPCRSQSNNLCHAARWGLFFLHIGAAHPAER